MSNSHVEKLFAHSLEGLRTALARIQTKLEAVHAESAAIRERIDAIDHRLGAIEQSFGGVDSKFADLNSEVKTLRASTQKSQEAMLDVIHREAGLIEALGPVKQEMALSRHDRESRGNLAYRMTRAEDLIFAATA